MLNVSVLMLLLDLLLKFAGCILVLFLFWGFAELYSRLFE